VAHRQGLARRDYWLPPLRPPDIIHIMPTIIAMQPIAGMNAAAPTPTATSTAVAATSARQISR
jgi:hypothetical protein